MTTKRRTTKSKPSRKRKKTKKKSGWITPGRVVLMLLFLGLLGGTAFVILEKDRFFRRGVPADWVDSVLIAARVDPTSQKKVVERDGVERWLITLPSRETKDRIIEALEGGVASQNGFWHKGEETWRTDSYVQLVELRREDGRPLRLIFMVKSERRKPRMQQKPPEPLEVAPPLAVKEDPVDEPDAPLVAIILDDIGLHSYTKLSPVLDLKFPITFAMLPHLPHTRENAIYFHQNRYEVMLHMPMEPTGYPRANPGEGAVLANMNEVQISDAVRRALADVPFVSGVNNHMGSRITANRSLMRPILDEVKRRDLFFVDSRTSANTVAYAMSQDYHMRSAKRDVFIDPEQSYEVALKQIDEIRRVARSQGYAVAIGHPYPTTLRALAEEMPEMDREGFRFVFASALVKRPDGQL